MVCNHNKLISLLQVYSKYDFEFIFPNKKNITKNIDFRNNFDFWVNKEKILWNEMYLHISNTFSFI